MGWAKAAGGGLLGRIKGLRVGRRGPWQGGKRRSRSRAGCQYPSLQTQQHLDAYIVGGCVDDSCGGQ